MVNQIHILAVSSFAQDHMRADACKACVAYYAPFVFDPDAAPASLLRACKVLYMLLRRLPVTLLLVSSTGQSAARKSLDGS
jgi:hypothetical protein